MNEYKGRTDLKVVWVQIGDIHPYERNNKNHSPELIAAMAEQLEKTGWDQSIVCEPDGTIIKGHKRYYASLLKNWPVVPVHYKNVTKLEAKAQRIADNKIVTEEYDRLNLEHDAIELKNEGFEAMDLGMSNEVFESLTAPMFAPEGTQANPGPDGQKPYDPKANISFTIVFNTKEEQGIWFTFCTWMKTAYRPDLPTLSEKLCAYLVEQQGG